MITLTAHADRDLIRAAGKSTRYLDIQVVAGPRTATERPPIHVAFAVDRSGSMAGQRLELARRATADALQFLAPTDRFTIVAFDDAVDTIAPPTSASYAAVALAKERLRAVQPGGSTALAAGWLTAAALIGPTTPEEHQALTRCFLLTDGHANVGETAPAALVHHARELRARGVVTTTFGLGEGFSEELLHGLSSAGGGHFYFIEHATQIRDFFTSELGETSEVVARDATVTVTSPRVSIEPLVAYTVEPAGGGQRMRLGDLVGNQVVDLIVKLTFSDGVPGEVLRVPIVVEARGLPPVEVEVVFTFGDHQANDRQPRRVEVDRGVAKAYAAIARRAAVAHNRAGEYHLAEQALARVARRVRGYSRGDAELEAVVAELDHDAESYGKVMNEGARKLAYRRSAATLEGRDETTGGARRAP